MFEPAVLAASNWLPSITFLTALLNSKIHLVHLVQGGFNWFASHSHTRFLKVRPTTFLLAAEATAVLFASCGPITKEQMIGREIMNSKGLWPESSLWHQRTP
jgi:hypothetical protein